MTSDELRELHYIAPIANAASILSCGILSHRLVKTIDHDSIAMQQVQERRENKLVPGGNRLHDYANLYFNARNPMMFVLRGKHAELCVFRVSPEVLWLPGVVVTDMNAAKNMVRFSPPRRGLELIDSSSIFADDWRHPGDRFRYYRHRGVMCAEVLVPDSVGTKFIIGAYVSCPEAEAALRTQALNSPVQSSISVNRHIFFL